MLTGAIKGLTALAEAMRGLTLGVGNTAAHITALGLTILAMRKSAGLGTAALKAFTASLFVASGGVKKLNFATKALGKTLKAGAIFLLIDAGLQLLSSSSKKTAQSVKDMSNDFVQVTLDVADFNHQVSRMKHSSEVAAEAAKINNKIVSNSFEGILNYALSSSEASRNVVAAYLEGIDEGIAPFVDFNKELITHNKMNKASVADLNTIVDALENINDLRTFGTGIITKTGEAAHIYYGRQKQNLIGLIKQMITLRQKDKDLYFEGTDAREKFLDNLLDQQTSLQNKIDFQGESLVLAELDNEIKKKNIQLSKTELEDAKEYAKNIHNLNEVLKQKQSIQQTAISQTSQLANAMTSMIFSVDVASLTWEKFGQTVVGVLNRIVAKFVAEMGVFLLFSKVLGVQGMTAPSIFGWSPFASSNTSGTAWTPDAPFQTFEYHSGGMIPQSYHSGGNVPIIAEEGEFVMRRSAVESIGVENLNRMNRTGQAGGVNVTFSGNVMSNDFIEDVAIPKIKDAIRRGADIGIG
tara:strand:- start:2471 stop:4042 length:1572 start_codon:yes stop_codon:yes gene_type:complete